MFLNPAVLILCSNRFDLDSCIFLFLKIRAGMSEPCCGRTLYCSFVYHLAFKAGRLFTCELVPVGFFVFFGHFKPSFFKKASISFAVGLILAIL